MTTTTNLNLKKPEYSDDADIGDINENMDIIDGAYGNLATGKVPSTRKVNGHALSYDVTVTKGDVGLGNVDNTSDANKPISNAQALVNTNTSNQIIDLKSAFHNVVDFVGLETIAPTNTYTGKAYDVNTSQLVDLSKRVTNKYTVTPGDYVEIYGYNGANRYPLYTIFDSSDNLIMRMPTDQTSDAGITREIIIPVNASYMYVCGYDSTTTHYLPTAKSLNSIEDAVNPIVDENETVSHKMERYLASMSVLTATTTYDNCIYNTDSGFITNNSYNVKKYTVTPGQLLRVSGAFPGTKNVLYAIFNSSDELIDKSPAEYVSADAVTLVVTIPENASYMYVLGYYGNQTSFPQKVETVEYTTDLDTALKYASIRPLKVEVSNKGVTVTEGLLKLNLQKVGANNLINFRQGYWGETQLFATSTDWLGPYDFNAENNANGDRLDPSKNIQSSNTTGGNHTIYSDPSNGTPTARTISWSAYADNVLLSEGDSVFCNKVRVEWVNKVQAGNTAKLDGTGRECLEEHYSAEFTGVGNVDICMYFKPLEDISMRWYSGMQFAGNSFADDIYIYEYSNSAMATSTINDYRNSDIVDYVVAEGDLCSLEMFMNRQYGLGKRQNEYYYDGQGNKGYFQLIARDNYSPVHMDAGDHFAWQGHYRFYHSVN